MMERLALTLLSLMLGGMCYVTGLVAPIIFMVLDDPEATEFTRKLWPRYFVVNTVLALFATVFLIYGEAGTLAPTLALLTGVFMATNWGCAMAMQQMRDPGTDYEKGTTYDWLHKYTVWTNTLSIVLIVGVVIGLIVRFL
jgi:hypothetical protein